MVSIECGLQIAEGGIERNCWRQWSQARTNREGRVLETCQLLEDFDHPHKVWKVKWMENPIWMNLLLWDIHFLKSLGDVTFGWGWVRGPTPDHATSAELKLSYSYKLKTKLHPRLHPSEHEISGNSFSDIWEREAAHSRMSLAPSFCCWIRSNNMIHDFSTIRRFSWNLFGTQVKVDILASDEWTKKEDVQITPMHLMHYFCTNFKEVFLKLPDLTFWRGEYEHWYRWMLNQNYPPKSEDISKKGHDNSSSCLVGDSPCWLFLSRSRKGPR